MGLLDLCDSDDELAMIVGHEVAHVVARHAGFFFFYLKLSLFFSIFFFFGILFDFLLPQNSFLVLFVLGERLSLSALRKYFSFVLVLFGLDVNYDILDAAGVCGVILIFFFDFLGLILFYFILGNLH